MLTRAFWHSTGERAVATFAQAFLGVYVVTGFDLDLLKSAAITGAVAAGLSVIKSVAVATLSDGNPSLGSSEVLAEPGATADPVGGEEVQVIPEHAEEDLNLS